MSDYASQVHAAAYSLAVAGFGTTFKTYRKTPMLQVQPYDLPTLSIQIMRERRSQDGQANQAEPKFIHELTLGFAGAVHVETDVQNELSWLEDAMSQLDDILLTNTAFVKLTEGVLAMDRVGQWAKVGETTLFEIRVEMTVQFRSYFPPVVNDVLKTVHITSQYPDKAHVDAGTPQVEAEWTLETDTGTTREEEPPPHP
jgi:hypothetical protein